MKLHEAIEKILKDAGKPMSVKDIADAINKHGFYQKRDGSPVSVSQIIHSIKKQPSLFDISNDIIFIKQESLLKKQNQTHNLKIMDDANLDLGASHKKMTLHEAIKKVILEYGQNLTFKEIASIINELKLYKRYDNLPVSTLQIRSRVRNYPHLFYTHDDTVSLKQFQPTLLPVENNVLQISDKITLSVTLSRIEEFLIRKSSLRKKELLLFILQLAYFSRKTFNRSYSIIDFNFKQFKYDLLQHVKKIAPKYFYRSFSENLSKVNDKFGFFFLDIFLSKIDGSDIKKFNDALLHYGYTSGELNVDKFLRHTTPPLINELLATIANPRENDIIFDPASGISNTLLEVVKHEQDLKVHGYEIDPVVASLGWMFLTLNNVKTFTINCIDSYTNPINISPKPNIIVCDMIGLTYFDVNSNNYSKKSTKQSHLAFFIRKLLSKLTPDNGRMVLNLPIAFLYSEKFVDLRKELILNNNLETIITMPTPEQDLFNQKDSCIVMISNSKPASRQNNVLFIGLHDIKRSFHEYIYTEIVKSELTKTIDEIAFGLSSNTISNHPKCKSISIDQIAKRGFDLWPGKYTSEISKVVAEADKKENLQSLESLLNSFTDFDKPKEHAKDVFKQVNIRDLNDDAFNFYLDLDKLNLINIDDKPFKLLSTSALLIARIGLKLKPTYFTYSGEPIAVSPNIFVFTVKEDLVNIEYLIMQLYSEFVLQQVSISRLPRIMPTIGRNDFLNIRIPLPVLSEQFNILGKSKEILSEKLTLSNFINSIHLANTPEEIKSEIERFALSQISEAKSVTFQNELEITDFPFSDKDLENAKYVIDAKEEGYKHMLLIDDNKTIYGLLSVETAHAIRHDIYTVVNAYAKFVHQTSTKYILENTNKLLEKFSHTTKNILSDIHSKISRIIETNNPKLQEALKASYIDNDDLIEYFVNMENKKKESFIAYNHLQETQEILKKHISFFKKHHESIRNRTNDSVSEIKLNDFLDQITHHKNQITIVKDSDFNPTLLIKSQSIIHAFIDLIDNANKHGSDKKAIIKYKNHDRYVEFTLSNNVDNLLSETNYKNLGKDDIKNDSGVYSTGLHNAFTTINEQNSIVLGSYETYKSKQIFEVIIKLKKS